MKWGTDLSGPFTVNNRARMVVFGDHTYSLFTLVSSKNSWALSLRDAL